MIAHLARRAICEAEESFHIYVDSVGGNDSTGTGSKARPYATLAKALTVVTAGQSIGLKSGSVFRPASAPAIAVDKCRLGRYGQGAKPIVSGGQIVTGWAQQLASPFVARCASTADATGTSHSVPVAAAVATGHTVLLAVKCGAGAAVTAVTDSKGNTWTIDKKSANATGATVALARGVITTALATSDTITVTTSISCSTASAAFDYTGTLTPDQNAQASGSSASASAGPITTTTASEIIISAVGGGSSQTSYTPPASFTDRLTNQTSQAVLLAERVVGATGTFTPTWAIISGAWAEVVVSYTMSAGGLSNTYSASLAPTAVFVTRGSGALASITGLAKGSSATTLTTDQWFWSSGTLYVNLGGTDPTTTTIEAAVRQSLTATDRNGLVLRGVDFRHGADRMVQLTRVNNFTIDRCEAHFCAYVANSGTISFGWSSASPSLASARLCRNIITRNQNDGIWWSGMPNVEIDNNVITNVGNLPGDVQSDAVQVYLGFGSCAGLWVHNNVTDMSATSSPKGHFACEGNPGQDLSVGSRPARFEHNDCTGGAYVFGGNASNLDVRFNTCRDQIVGGGTMQVDATGGTATNLRIYRNLILRPAAAGLYVASGGPALIGFVCANNTVIDCAGIPVNIQPASIDATSVVGNNLVWNPNVAPGANMVKAWPTTGGLPAGWDRNLYPADRANGYQFKGTNYATLAAWRTGAAADANSLSGADPLLDANYVPGVGSPARNAGQVITGVTDGYLGASPDIGYAEAA